MQPFHILQPFPIRIVTIWVERILQQMFVTLNVFGKSVIKILHKTVELE